MRLITRFLQGNLVSSALAKGIARQIAAAVRRRGPAVAPYVTMVNPVAMRLQMLVLMKKMLMEESLYQTVL